jgi:hypothetical protein
VWRRAGTGAIGGDMDGFVILSHASSTRENRFGSVSCGTLTGIFQTAAGNVA